jgi:hypothetical protein
MLGRKKIVMHEKKKALGSMQRKEEEKKKIVKSTSMARTRSKFNAVQSEERGSEGSKCVDDIMIIGLESVIGAVRSCKSSIFPSFWWFSFVFGQWPSNPVPNR